MYLSSGVSYTLVIFPGWGGGGGHRAVGRGIGDFVGTLEHSSAPVVGGIEGPLIYFAPEHGEIWGFCFR